MSLIPVARGDGVALSPTQWRYVRVADAFSRSARCAFPGSHARTTPAVCLSVRPSVRPSQNITDTTILITSSSFSSMLIDST